MFDNLRNKSEFIKEKKNRLETGCRLPGIGLLIY